MSNSMTQGRPDSETGFHHELLPDGTSHRFQFSITAIGSIPVVRKQRTLAVDYVAAFTAGAKLKQFTMCPFDAIATAVSVFWQPELRSPNFDRSAKDSARVSQPLWATDFAGLVLIFAGRPLADLCEQKTQSAFWPPPRKYLRCMGYLLVS